MNNPIKLTENLFAVVVPKDATEIWKQIKGYEGYYEISNLGNVKSLGRKCFYNIHHTGKRNFRIKKEKIMKKSICYYGYEYVNLIDDLGNRKINKVHRLVAINFIENPLNKSFVNHINGIKTDNRLQNLEWCTHQENVQHAFKTGLNFVERGDLNKTTLFKDSEILEIKNYFKSHPKTNKKEYAKSIGMSRQHLWRILTGKERNI